MSNAGLNARFWATSIAAASLALWAACPAAATEWRPKGTTSIMVPTTAGTGLDVLARMLGEELKQRWGTSFVVENKAGASSNLGVQAVARSAPDGLSLLLTSNTFVTNTGLFKNLPYDPVRSFRPISKLAIGYLALAVHPTVKAQTLRDFIALAKAQPGGINYASTGRGTPQHLAMELFQQATATRLTHIPYPGSAGAAKDLAGGFVSAMFIPLHQALPLVHGGQIRLLAVGSDNRSPLAPDVPTLVEQGVDSFNVDLWYALLAPAGTPDEIITTYNTAVNEILGTPKVQSFVATQGLQVIGGAPEVMTKLISYDLERWSKVVKEAGLVPE